MQEEYWVQSMAFEAQNMLKVIDNIIEIVFIAFSPHNIYLYGFSRK
jgi:hypothetical protein